jgi:hypothetical protein
VTIGKRRDDVVLSYVLRAPEFLTEILVEMASDIAPSCCCMAWTAPGCTCKA